MRQCPTIRKFSIPLHPHRSAVFDPDLRPKGAHDEALPREGGGKKGRAEQSRRCLTLSNRPVFVGFYFGSRAVDCSEPYAFPAAFRLEAFKGFSSLVTSGAFSFMTWVARLQSRADHLAAGSAQAMQNFPVGKSAARSHPWQRSTIG